MAKSLTDFYASLGTGVYQCAFYTRSLRTVRKYPDALTFQLKYLENEEL